MKKQARRGDASVIAPAINTKGGGIVEKKHPKAQWRHDSTCSVTWATETIFPFEYIFLHKPLFHVFLHKHPVEVASQWIVNKARFLATFLPGLVAKYHVVVPAPLYSRAFATSPFSLITAILASSYAFLLFFF